ncbi:MAG: PUA domain-containing protein, partial [Promethearchaeota archaeon]
CERTRRVLESMTYERAIWFKRKVNVDMALSGLIDELSIVTVSSATDATNKLPPGDEDVSWTRRKLRALLMHQWGVNAGELADLDGLKIDLSKSTGKIRHCKIDDEILFTLVPTTGLLTPTYLGGQQLLRIGLNDTYKVVIDSDVSEFVATGKSALAKFVKIASTELKAGEEVLVLDEDQNLLGTGRAQISGCEMTSFNRGVAVQIRHSRKS